MAYTCILSNNRRGTPLGTNTNTNSRRGESALALAKDAITAAGVGGANPGGFTILNNETAAKYLHRSGAVVIVATTGSATVVVNGTSVTADFTSSLTATVAAAVAAINADATAKKYVSALTRVAKLTTVSAIAGDTVSVFGVTFTAQGSAATAGTEQWDIRTSDTAAGLSLATQINSHPVLVNKCFAVNSAGVVYISLLEDRAPRSDEVIASTGGTVTVNSQVATGVAMPIVANCPGIMGNACTLTVTGTGSSAISLVSGKLGGGTGFETVVDVIESSFR